MNEEITSTTAEQQADSPEIEQGEIIDQTPAASSREQREIVSFEAGGGLNAMIPQTPEEYARLANLLGAANCVPASYLSNNIDETRSKLIIGLMKSVEIGVPPITGLNGIMIINNRPSVWGDLAISLIQRSGQLQKMEVQKFGPEPQQGQPLNQWDEGFGFRVTMWRKGQELPYVGAFTVGDAKRAKLWENTKKKPWIYYPMDMLFNRARAKAARMGFADALHGMGIAEEERDIVEHEDQKHATASLLDDTPITIEELEQEEQEDG